MTKIFTTKIEEIITSEDPKTEYNNAETFEENIERNMQALLIEPNDTIIERILNYSKNLKIEQSKGL